MTVRLVCDGRCSVTVVTKTALSFSLSTLLSSSRLRLFFQLFLSLSFLLFFLFGIIWHWVFLKAACDSWDVEYRPWFIFYWLLSRESRISSWLLPVCLLYVSTFFLSNSRIRVEKEGEASSSCHDNRVGEKKITQTVAVIFSKTS